MKKTKKHWFILDWGTYTNQTFFSVGYTPSEILKILKKKKWVNKEFVDAITEDLDLLNDTTGKFSAFVWHKKGASIFWVPFFEDDWKFWDTIVHETHHLVRFMSDDKMMLDEEEAQAYQQEYFFRTIRRKLSDKFIKN